MQELKPTSVPQLSPLYAFSNSMRSSESYDI